MGEVSEERRGAVRAANLDIGAIAAKADFRERLPLLCECGDPDCTGFVRLGPDAFNVVAAREGWFILGDAHGARYEVIDAANRESVIRVA